MSLPSIPGALAGKHVFVTGGSGFMGKVLVEKLLRSCPELACIHLLLRPRRGAGIEDRLRDVLKAPLFEPLLKDRPAAALQLRAVAGDCSQLRLGLSAEDEAMLQDNVSYVFHAAATVRFDDPLQSAILLNTRGTREVVELCKRMRRLQVLQYVSTTYCFTEQPVLKEQAYRAHHDWRSMIRLAETEDKAVLDALSSKILEHQPNTYTFSKALAENVINDARHDIPVMIFRPAVVVSTLMEPIAGWIDNLNGPFSIWFGAMKGVLRFIWADPDVALSFTPVDWAIRGMILCAVNKASKESTLQAGPEDVDVVNMEVSLYERLTYRTQLDNLEGLRFCSANVIRYPRAHLGKCYIYYWLGTLLSELPYGLLIDILLRLRGQKPRMMNIYRKVFYSNRALAYFMMNEFPIEAIKFEKLSSLLNTADKPSFGVCLSDPDCRLVYKREQAMKDVCIQANRYLFNEEYSREKTEKRLKRLYVLEIAMNIVWCAVMYLTVGRFLLWKIDRLIHL